MVLCIRQHVFVKIVTYFNAFNMERIMRVAWVCLVGEGEALEDAVLAAYETPTLKGDGFQFLVVIQFVLS